MDHSVSLRPAAIAIFHRLAPPGLASRYPLGLCGWCNVVSDGKITVTKLDAARRQLRAAIRL